MSAWDEAERVLEADVPRSRMLVKPWEMWRVGRALGRIGCWPFIEVGVVRPSCWASEMRGVERGDGFGLREKRCSIILGYCWFGEASLWVVALDMSLGGTSTSESSSC